MKLVLVYKAHSGVVNGIIDSLHKILSPSSYPCDLCKLTHNIFKEKKAWSNFSSSLSLEVFHLDELKPHLESYRHKAPIILLQLKNNRYCTIANARELKSINSTHELISLIETRINTNQNT